MVHTGQLKGSLVGRQEKMMYIPDIYTRAQNEWVDSFYRQNGYLGMWNLKIKTDKIDPLLQKTLEMYIFYIFLLNQKSVNVDLAMMVYSM